MASKLTRHLLRPLLAPIASSGQFAPAIPPASDSTGHTVASFVATPTSAYEGSTHTVTLTLNAAVGGSPIVIPVALSGSEQSQRGYPAPASITIAAGSKSGSTTLTTTNEGAYSGDTTLTFTAQLPARVSGSNPSTSVTVMEASQAPAPAVTGVSKGSGAVSERGVASFYVSVWPAPATAVGFPYSVGGTASPADYSSITVSNGGYLSGGYLYFPAGVTGVWVNFALVWSDSNEGNETLVLTVGGYSDTVIITDSE